LLLFIYLFYFHVRIQVVGGENIFFSIKVLEFKAHYLVSHGARVDQHRLTQTAVSSWSPPAA
jgi:hypothetical protein